MAERLSDKLGTDGLLYDLYRLADKAPFGVKAEMRTTIQELKNEIARLRRQVSNYRCRANKARSALTAGGKNG